jgi:V/A-type H+-transporting ATPase subunit C
MNEADFVYGNTRLRARLPTLLGRQDLERLLTLEPEALLAELSSTPYAPEVAAEAARGRMPGTLHRAAMRHLARSLHELRSFYDGAAGDVVDLLLQRWDLHNVLVLARAHARGIKDAAAAALVPLGGLDEPTAAELSRQREPAAAVDRLVTWRLPTPQLAAALQRGWAAYDRDQDLSSLEGKLAAAAWTSILERARDLGSVADPVAALVRREADLRNAIAALRAAADPDDAGNGVFVVPAGTLPGTALAAAARDDAAADAARRLAALPTARLWRATLERFAQDGTDLACLEGELEADSAAAARLDLRRGDPLGASVPTAFTVLKELEVRNLRVVAQAAAGGDIQALASELITR